MNTSDAPKSRSQRLPDPSSSAGLKKAASIILDGIESDNLHICVGKDSKMMKDLLE